MEIDQANRPDRVESLSLEYGHQSCSLSCLYCYSRGPRIQRASRRPRRQPLSVSEWPRVLDQACQLGLKGVGIIGPYEPLGEPGILDLIDEIRKRGPRVTVFTNGTCLTPELAVALHQRSVTVGISVHSLNARVHDELSGKRGSFARVRHGISILLRGGYQTERARIVIQSVATRRNAKDLPALWRWACESGFTPFFERITIQGAARQNLEQLSITPEIFRTACERVAQVDQQVRNKNWAPHPPWLGQACTRHLNSCHITFDGYVQPCTGVDIPIGNVCDANLRDILLGSDMMWSLRNIRHTIRGACRNCSFHDECYGCRGQAYQLTGDYLAADPCCWMNPERCASTCGVRPECLATRQVEMNTAPRACHPHSIVDVSP